MSYDHMSPATSTPQPHQATTTKRESNPTHRRSNACQYQGHPPDSDHGKAAAVARAADAAATATAEHPSKLKEQAAKPFVSLRRTSRTNRVPEMSFVCHFLWRLESKVKSTKAPLVSLSSTWLSGIIVHMRVCVHPGCNRRPSYGVER